MTAPDLATAVRAYLAAVDQRIAAQREYDDDARGAYNSHGFGGSPILGGRVHVAVRLEASALSTLRRVTPPCCPEMVASGEVGGSDTSHEGAGTTTPCAGVYGDDASGHGGERVFAMPKPSGVFVTANGDGTVTVRWVSGMEWKR